MPAEVSLTGPARGWRFSSHSAAGVERGADRPGGCALHRQVGASDRG